MAAKSGEQSAVEVLYRDLHPGVLAFATARVGTEGEDLAADVFVTMATALARFEGDERALRRWVFAIAYRKVGEAWRRARQRGTHPAPVDELGLRAPIGDVEAEALDGLSTSEALTAIARLGPPQSEVVLLRVVADLSVEEVATIVGKRPGAIRALQHRALIRLAQEVPGSMRNTEALPGHSWGDEPS